MGNRFTRPSTTWIPCPENKKDKIILEGLGVEFILKKDDDEKEIPFEFKEDTMVQVKLSEKWGLWLEKDTGINIIAMLIDELGREIAKIYWRSKGTYDNRCSISIIDLKLSRRLNLDKVTKEDGWYYPPYSFKEKYYDLVNSYYESQFRGVPQSELDEKYEYILSFEADHKDEFLKQNIDKIEHNKLDEQRSDKDVVFALTMNFVKPFIFKSDSVWL